MASENLDKVTITRDHPEKFFMEHQLNTHLGPRMKLLVILTVLLGSALIALSVEESGIEREMGRPGSRGTKRKIPFP